MGSYSIKRRINESQNIWPGFVDILATLLIVIIFILMVFTVSQFYLSDAVMGRDKALAEFKIQIQELKSWNQELSKILSATKEELETETEKNIQLSQQIQTSEGLLAERDIAVVKLSSQIGELTEELKIVAMALEKYEDEVIEEIETAGLGERINMALAKRVDQLKNLNTELNLSQKETAEQLQIVEQLNKNLIAINKSLGLDDAGLVEQLEAIKRKNTELALANQQLELSEQQISEQLKIVEELNKRLSFNEEELQNQVREYQKLTEELIALNDNLDLKDKTLVDQLELIKNKNTELALLNENLIKKDNTIFDLRGKILELNNILSIGEETRIAKQAEIVSLSKKIQVLEEEKTQVLTQQTEIQSLNQRIATLENEKQKLLESSNKEIIEAQMKASITLEQVTFLSKEIEILTNEINTLNFALEASEQTALIKELKIEVLGERLNKALTSKVFELQKYRSEFFGRLKEILGDRDDIKVVGDRFIFESELLFDSASATLQSQGKEKLKQIGLTLKETTMSIPEDIDWIIQVEGHTDKNPINTPQFPSNWELSTARANSVLKLLLDIGFKPNQLSAAGYGEAYPIDLGESKEDLRRNRRIELKLTTR